VLVITHLPQIAARADQHLVVSKEARGGIATSDVQVIHGEDRVSEVARMLGDAEGAAARRHAQEMLTTDRRTGTAEEAAAGGAGGADKHRGGGAAGRREGKRK
jgi:DNA repair protein RecN (Recombination protein N)